MNAVRILLADEHNLVRKGIRLLLQTMDWVEVVGEAKNGQEVLTQATDLNPDVVLMDINMSYINGLEATCRLKEIAPDVKIIILSSRHKTDYLWQVMRAGANGYLIKDAEIEELRLGIRTVMRGQLYISPFILSSVVSDYLVRTKKQFSHEKLGVRQREILQMIAQGFTNREISAKLGITTKTTETHRAQLMKHLEVQNTAGLVRYAVRIGLVLPDE